MGALDVRTAGNGGIAELLNQPKRPGILAYLALAPDGRARRRDELLALFWPESGEGSARNALNQTIYRLRAVLGEDTLISNEQEVRLDPDRVWCDATALRTAFAAGDDRRVVELYRGDLMDAFHVRGAAAEFEMWLASERDALRSMAIRSAWKTSEAETALGNQVGAAHFARFAVSLTPTDEEAVRRLLVLLDGLGDRSGAVRAYDEFAAALARLYDLQPSPELRAFAADLRARPSAVRLHAVAAPAAPVVSGDVDARNARRMQNRQRASIAAALSLVLVIAAALLHGKSDALPVVAVGNITAESSTDTLPVALLLSTSLSRIPGLTVIPEDRVDEVRTQMRAAVGPADRRRAALHAGAGHVIEGVLSQRDGMLRLDLRSIDRDEKARGGHVVEGRTLYDVVDLATEQVARDFGLSAPVNRLDATNASLVAYRLYELGLHAFHANDMKGADHFFRAALAEDPAFAMAAYYDSRITEGKDRWQLIQRARVLSAKSPEHERLLIAAEAAATLHEMNALAIAESAAVRYPADPEASQAYAGALLTAGRFVDAVSWFRHAADLDSLSMYSAAPRCSACDAWRGLIVAYMLADSPRAVEREARALVVRFPKSPMAWLRLGDALGRLEKFNGSDSAFARTAGIGAEDRRSNATLSNIGIREQQFAAVDAAWDAQRQSTDPEERQGAYWGSFISLQTQGRAREAYAAARTYSRMSREAGDEYRVLEALALMGLGRYSDAAHIFEAEERKSAAAAGPLDARVRAWNLTHAAAAYAAGHDTTKLAMLEDSIRIFGARSPYARDQRLHYYVRGLRLQAHGQYAAARAAFEKSVYSLHEGYVRIPLEIARSSLQLGDAARAIAVLRPALLGPLSASGLYASRTDLLELLGDAYAHNGQADSASAVYGRVLKSWQRADPAMQPRVQSVRARLALVANR